MSQPEIPSTRPYLIRALHEWCSDNGYSPYVVVHVDDSVQVPREVVQNGEVVLNISFDATGHLLLGNEFIEFKARFGGVAREVLIPVDHVVAIYAKENGQGMAFPAPLASTAKDAAADTPRGAEDAGAKAGSTDGKGLQLVSAAPDGGSGDAGGETAESASTSAGPRPSLTRVK